MLVIRNLAIKLKALRTLRSMHQRELAQKTGIHNNLIVDYEKGRAIPSPEQLRLIEEALGIQFNAETESAFAVLAPDLQLQEAA